jgi:hypothetical protein
MAGDMTCEACGKELAVGQWPWCPHEDARNFGEQPMEPYFDEHITPEGAHITTRAERRRIMYANKQEYHDVSSKRRGKLYIDMGRR